MNNNHDIVKVIKVLIAEIERLRKQQAKSAKRRKK